MTVFTALKIRGGGWQEWLAVCHPAIGVFTSPTVNNLRLRPGDSWLTVFADMKSDHISKAGKSIELPAHSKSQPPRRILRVDDDRDVRDLNAQVLVRAGYHVETAENGAAGWKALQAGHYDALITDNTMPGVTGLELIKKLRSEDMTLPVILASGTVPAEELNRCPWLQVDALLPKPYTVAQLLRTVDRVLQTAGDSH